MFDILVRSKIFKLHSYNSKYRREMNGIKQRFSVFLGTSRVNYCFNKDWLLEHEFYHQYTKLETGLIIFS